MRRSRGRLWGAVASLTLTLAFAAAPASAHVGDPSVMSGMFELAPGEVRALEVAGMVASDMVEWNWSHEGGNVSMFLVWRDAAGGVHRVAETGARTGWFQAPANLTSASLEWTNAGGGPAHVSWGYVCSSEFWTQPWMVAAAAVPVILLLVALGAGRWVDRRANAAKRSEGENDER